MTDAETRARIRKKAAYNKAMFIRTVMENPYIPITDKRPSRKQARFLSFFGRENLFGGSVGGGKSDALLMAALQFVSVPDYSAILVRRVHKHLTQSDGLIPRFFSWMRETGHAQGKHFRWKAQESKAIFPNGASIGFGYCDNNRDLDAFQGGSWHYIGIDEVGQWPKHYYTYLFSRQRKPAGFRVPIRIRASANPGGVGHQWLKARFIDAKTAFKYFIPSRLDDNPGLDRDDYLRSLEHLDPILKAQLVNGDWNAYEGGRFFADWFGSYRVELDAKQNVWIVFADGFRVPAKDCQVVITVDPACTPEQTTRKAQDADYTVIGVYGVVPESKRLFVIKIIRERLRVDHIVPMLEQVCLHYKAQWVGIEDVGFQVFIKLEAEKSEKIPTVMGLSHGGQNKLTRATPAIIRASEGQIFLPEIDVDRVGAMCKVCGGKCKLPNKPWVEEWIAELTSFTGDDKQDSHDDQVDSLAWAVIGLDRFGPSAPSIIESPEPTIIEAVEHSGYYYGRQHRMVFDEPEEVEE